MTLTDTPLSLKDVNGPLRLKLRQGFALQQGFFILWLLVWDAALAYFSLRMAYDLRVSGQFLPYQGPQQPQVYASYFLLSLVLWPAIFTVAGLYRIDSLLDGVDEYRSVLKACAAAALILIVISFWRRDEADISRGWILLTLLINTFLTFVVRFVSRRLVYLARRRGHFTARTLIVGANAQGEAIARQWQAAPSSGMKVIGFLDDFKPVGTPVGKNTVLGPPTALDAIARELKADEVVLVQNAVSWESFQEIVSRPPFADSFVLRLSPGYYDILSNNGTLATKSFVPLFTINQSRIEGEDMWLKYAIDYGIGAVFFLISLPFSLLFGAWLKALGRPVLDRHLTLGRNDHLFTRYQFHARKDGTPLEVFLLRTGLDKLPQFLNVVKGEMGLVGVRPRAADDKVYAAHPSRGIFRAVKPGFVGYYSFLPEGSEESDQRDLHYVRNWTVWVDLQILKDSLLALVGLRKIRAS